MNIILNHGLNFQKRQSQLLRKMNTQIFLVFGYQFGYHTQIYLFGCICTSEIYFQKVIYVECIISVYLI